MQTVPEGAGAFGLPPRGDTTEGGSETHTLRQEVGSQPREKRAISRDPVFARVPDHPPAACAAGKEENRSDL